MARQFTSLFFAAIGVTLLALTKSGQAGAVRRGVVPSSGPMEGRRPILPGPSSVAWM